jgi:hypothetical protein
MDVTDDIGDRLFVLECSLLVALKCDISSIRYDQAQRNCSSIIPLDLAAELNIDLGRCMMNGRLGDLDNATQHGC